GVPAAANNPNDTFASYPGTVSAIVGTSGNCGTRFSLPKASILSFPSFTELSATDGPIITVFDVPGNHITQRWSRAAIVHGRHLDAGETLQLEAGNVQCATDAGCPKGHGPWLLLGERDQVAYRIDRHRRIHEQRCRNGAVAGNRDEVLLC